MAQRSKLCEANSEQTNLGTARGRDVGSSSLFTPTRRKTDGKISLSFSLTKIKAYAILKTNKYSL